jgi:rRNA-processing protein FCF1
MNQVLRDNNKIVYENMKLERAIITEATAAAVATKVDAVVTQAVARALSKLRPATPQRKKRSSEGQDTIVRGGEGNQ